MERTQTNNAARALRMLCLQSPDEVCIEVKIRHEDMKRPGMASYAQGGLLHTSSLENGDTAVVLDDSRLFLLSTIEAIEIKGGLGDARRFQ